MPSLRAIARRRSTRAKPASANLSRTPRHRAREPRSRMATACGNSLAAPGIEIVDPADLTATCTVPLAATARTTPSRWRSTARWQASRPPHAGLEQAAASLHEADLTWHQHFRLGIRSPQKPADSSATTSDLVIKPARCSQGSGVVTPLVFTNWPWPPLGDDRHTLPQQRPAFLRAETCRDQATRPRSGRPRPPSR